MAEEGGIFWSQDDVRRGYHQAPQEKAQIYPSLNVSRMMPQHDPVVNHSHESNLLLYNRVPKCASSTMQVVLSTLMEANNFFYDASSLIDAVTSHRFVPFWHADPQDTRSFVPGS